MLDTVFFYAFAALAIGGALGTVLRRSAVHSAISLIVSLLGVAGLYLLMQAEFLFVTQIILYVGGVMVLFLFVIMLVNLDQAAGERQFADQWKWALAGVAGLGLEMFWLLRRGAVSLPAAVTPEPNGLGNTEFIAESLFHDYLVPFEVASLLLLVAVVGSVLMAQRRERE